MTKNNKKHIEVLHTVYEVDIVIANKYVTLEDLKKKYAYYDGVELDNDITASQASTARCIDIKTNRPVVLIKYNCDSSIKGVNKKLDLINTASHEATHAAMYIFSYVREFINTDQSNESLAYLIGWITQHTYEIWTKK